MSKKEAEQALARLIEGNARFVNGKQLNPNRDRERRTELEGGERPVAAIVTCSDSRVTPEIIFDQGLGDIFVVRTLGNVCDGNGLASMEYAVENLGVLVVLVLGHTNCGAIAAAVSGERLKGRIGALTRRFQRAVRDCKDQPGDLLKNSILANVELEVERLFKTSRVISREAAKGNIIIIGAVYDLHTGIVTML
jgi:carbonic anhydrase